MEVPIIPSQVLPQQQIINEQKCCRICLQQQPIDDLQAPCNCKGSTKHIHQKCLLEWATKNQRPVYTQSSDSYHLQCQICKSHIQLTHIQSSHIRTCKQIKQQIVKQKMRLLVEISGLMVIIFVLIYAVGKHEEYTHPQNDKGRETELLVILSLIAVIMSALLLIGTSVYFAYGYIVDVRIEFQLKRKQVQPDNFQLEVTPNINANKNGLELAQVHKKTQKPYQQPSAMGMAIKNPTQVEFN